ncbi:unnamed protein product [Pieris brassicae]|uniref:Uncharacterized protein n=1 Tax=Pieris brassicae TaxID=7116 RepID=A0A9P0TTT8_PIEBR|nr:unnamed protein product [Pieris brassicae]
MALALRQELRKALRRRVKQRRDSRASGGEWTVKIEPKLYLRDYNATPLFASENASSEVWSAGGGGGSTACGSSGMDLKHEVAYRGLPSQVKAEPGVSHNGHPLNGHARDWMAGGGGSPSPGAAQPQPNGYSSPLSSSSYGPYSPNGKIAASPTRIMCDGNCVTVGSVAHITLAWNNNSPFPKSLAEGLRPPSGYT